MTQDSSVNTETSVVQKDVPLEPKAYVIKAGETDYLTGETIPTGAIRSNVKEYEDEFSNEYGLGKLVEGLDVIEPPYQFTTLERMYTENNSLQPCIEAMVTNVDGTGYSIDTTNDESKDTHQNDIEALEGFFKEPWPGQSFTTIRKALREDYEVTGNAYLEVLRNPKGDVVAFRNIDAKTMRMVRLDHPVTVIREVYRNGARVPLQIRIRERRFAQKINGVNTFFKEFGSTRTLDFKTGSWGDNTEYPATEVLQFTANKDVNTPYGVPRWISQTPSVVGSRRAEEHNLSFFESGGIPPIMVFVQGGTLAKEGAEAIRQQLYSKGDHKHTASVIEAHSTGGSLDSSNNVRVTVERFGSERQKDSMFEGYDERCESRIRRSFRLPPIFVGKADDYSFATAFASYSVAEAQVFKPERDEFDEIITLRLLPHLTKNVDLVFRSHQLAVKDVANQLQALQLAADKEAIDKEQLVDTLNEITNLNMKLAELPDMPSTQLIAPDSDEEKIEDKVNPSAGKDTPTQQPTSKSEDWVEILADEVADLIQSGNKGYAMKKAAQEVGELSGADLSRFKKMLTIKTMESDFMDPDSQDLIYMSFLSLAKNSDPEYV